MHLNKRGRIYCPYSIIIFTATRVVFYYTFYMSREVWHTNGSIPFTLSYKVSDCDGSAIGGLTYWRLLQEGSYIANSKLRREVFYRDAFLNN